MRQPEEVSVAADATGSKKDKSVIRERCNEMKSLASAFIEDTAHANNLVDVLQCLTDTLGTEESKLCTKLAMVTILSLEKMVSHALANIPKPKARDSDAVQQYREWLIQQFEATVTLLLRLLISKKNKSAALRSQSLVSAMHLLASHARHISRPQKFCLPQENFYNLVRAMTRSRGSLALVSRFSEFSALHDVALQLWSVAPRLMKAARLSHRPKQQKAVLALLQVTPLPDVNLRQEEPDKLLFPDRAGTVVSSDRVVRQLAEDAWSELRLWPASRASLLVLLDTLMSKLSKPQFLTDHLLTALDQGGVVSVLALQGMFNLVKDHNIELPNIYTQLYALLTPDMFETKYKSRLLHLTDTFLTSTHLPEALVASFAKRLARLALNAPATDVASLVPLVGNLLIRHRGLQALVQHPTGQLMTEDPFLPEERDPMATRAVESSLWEVKSLQQHLLPSAAGAARFINDKISSVESDLADTLDLTYRQVFNKEVAKRPKGEIFLTFQQPDSEKLLQNSAFNILSKVAPSEEQQASDS